MKKIYIITLSVDEPLPTQINLDEAKYALVEFSDSNYPSIYSKSENQFYILGKKHFCIIDNESWNNKEIKTVRILKNYIDNKIEILFTLPKIKTTQK